MSRPSQKPVTPHREGLLHPLQNIRQLKPIRRPDIKHKPFIGEPQPRNFEDKPPLGLLKYPAKQRQGLPEPEQWLPVINRRADFIPHTLL
jgi:hypothetical protein